MISRTSRSGPPRVLMSWTLSVLIVGVAALPSSSVHPAASRAELEAEAATATTRPSAGSDDLRERRLERIIAGGLGANGSRLVESEEPAVPSTSTTTSSPPPTSAPPIAPPPSTVVPISDAPSPPEATTPPAAETLEARFARVVPSAWRNALPVRVEVIAGATSWARPGLIQISRAHADGDSTLLDVVIAHEFAHLIAFRYGSQAYNGAGPQGWPATTSSPAEHWADCVQQAWLGTVWPSHGLPPCGGDQLAWAQSYLAAGPP